MHLALGSLWHGIKTRPKTSILAACAIILVPFIASNYKHQTLLDQIKQSGELRVVTRLGSSTYYTEADQPGGFEYELMQLYANYLGVKLDIQVVNTVDEIYDAIRLSNAHIAAAGLVVTEERQQRFDFAPPYLYSSTQVVYSNRSIETPPQTVADLVGRQIEIVPNTSHEVILSAYHELKTWKSADSLEVISLLEKVDNGELEYTLVDEHEFRANKPFFPHLRVAMTLSGKQPIAWMIKKRLDNSLKASLDHFFSIRSIRSQIAKLEKKYYEPDIYLGFVDQLTFNVHYDSRFPKYIDWFKEAAAANDLDWQLLAAIGYQESHWNRRAVSPTGVRGIMMLTQQTSKELGVKKRTDPKQSIFGGARYFARQRNRLPERITEPDRTWLALAVYNVGWGHLEDARILTQNAGKDPDKWEDVAKHLPLLSQPRWYKTLKHGYARGWEPVTYVNNIRKYYEQIKLETRLEEIQSAQAEFIEEGDNQQTIKPATLIPLSNSL